MKQSYLTPLINLRAKYLENGQPSPVESSLMDPPARANVCTFRVTSSRLPFTVR